MSLLVDSINQPVRMVDSAAPGFSVTQRFRFPQPSGQPFPLNAFDKLIDFISNLAVGMLPFQVLIPSLVRPQFIYRRKPQLNRAAAPSRLPVARYRDQFFQDTRRSV